MLLQKKLIIILAKAVPFFKNIVDFNLKDFKLVTLSMRWWKSYIQSIGCSSDFIGPIVFL